MIDVVQVFWTPAGVTLPSVGARALIDITDGDTPNIRLPIRMLSVDTPEVTAGSEQRAQVIDGEFAQLAEWIRQGHAPISRSFAEFLLPKLETGKAASLQLEQGRAASAFAKANAETRLTRPNGTKRNLFIRIADQAFDDNGRLLAYVAPNYSAAERASMTRKDRATFNLDLIESGWAAPFMIYPTIPGELDLPLLLEAADSAMSGPEPRGIWANPHTLLAYDYRAVEKLFRITRRIVAGEVLSFTEAHSWRTRYCVDMRSRSLHGPEDYHEIPAPYRLWIWPQHVHDAVGLMNLVPCPRLVGAA